MSLLKNLILFSILSLFSFTFSSPARYNYAEDIQDEQDFIQNKRHWFKDKSYLLMLLRQQEQRLCYIRQQTQPQMYGPNPRPIREVQTEAHYKEFGKQCHSVLTDVEIFLHHDILNKLSEQKYLQSFPTLLKMYPSPEYDEYQHRPDVDYLAEQGYIQFIEQHGIIVPDPHNILPINLTYRESVMYEVSVELLTVTMYKFVSSQIDLKYAEDLVLDKLFSDPNMSFDAPSTSSGFTSFISQTLNKLQTCGLTKSALYHLGELESAIARNMVDSLDPAVILRRSNLNKLLELTAMHSFFELSVV